MMLHVEVAGIVDTYQRHALLLVHTNINTCRDALCTMYYAPVFVLVSGGAILVALIPAPGHAVPQLVT